jgi:hypothetical protein
MTSEEQQEIDQRRFAARRATFIAEGLCEEQAEELARSMMARDAENRVVRMKDDRRVCFECAHYQRKLCVAIRDKADKPTMPLRFVLQRCPKFQLKGKP